MNDIDEFAHMIKHLSGQQAGDFKPSMYGHASAYDPLLHRVKLLVPSLRDIDGKPMLTGWIPLQTLMVGNGSGIQFAPNCGATLENPTAGELMQISVIDRDGGLSLAAGFHYTQVMAPPFGEMQGGELGIKHQSGSMSYYHQNGDIEHAAQGKIIVSAQGEVNISGEATVNIDSSATINFAGGGPAVARVGDPVTGGVILGGSGKVFSG